MWGKKSQSQRTVRTFWLECYFNVKNQVGVWKRRKCHVGDRGLGEIRHDASHRKYGWDVQSATWSSDSAHVRSSIVDFDVWNGQLRPFDGDVGWHYSSLFGPAVAQGLLDVISAVQHHRGTERCRLGFDLSVLREGWNT